VQHNNDGLPATSTLTKIKRQVHGPPSVPKASLVRSVDGQIQELEVKNDRYKLRHPEPYKPPEVPAVYDHRVKKKKPLGAIGDQKGEEDHERVDVRDLPVSGQQAVLSLHLSKVALSAVQHALPWQAVLCPRAVESLWIERFAIAQEKQVKFFDEMESRLKSKVEDFTQATKSDLKSWKDFEYQCFKKSIGADENSLEVFLQTETARQQLRLKGHKSRAGKLEFQEMSVADYNERDFTREQLVTFRVLCRAKGRTDVRSLHAAIESGRNKMRADAALQPDSWMWKKEEAFEGLCCIGDNALATVAVTEWKRVATVGYASELQRSRVSGEEMSRRVKSRFGEMMARLFLFIDNARRKSLEHYKRERLITISFQNYIDEIFAQKRTNTRTHAIIDEVSWDNRNTYMRSESASKSYYEKRLERLVILEKLAGRLRTSLVVDMEKALSDVQSTLLDHDKRVHERQTEIHKKLDSFLRATSADRRYELTKIKEDWNNHFIAEGNCVTLIAGHCADLRFEIDRLWVQELLREKRLTKYLERHRGRELQACLQLVQDACSVILTEQEDAERWAESMASLVGMMLSDRRALQTKAYDQFTSKFIHDVDKYKKGIREKFLEVIEYFQRYSTPFYGAHTGRTERLTSPGSSPKSIPSPNQHSDHKRGIFSNKKGDLSLQVEFQSEQKGEVRGHRKVERTGKGIGECSPVRGGSSPSRSRTNSAENERALGIKVTRSWSEGDEDEVTPSLEDRLELLKYFVDLVFEEMEEKLCAFVASQVHYLLYYRINCAIVFAYCYVDFCFWIARTLMCCGTIHPLCITI